MCAADLHRRKKDKANEPIQLRFSSSRSIDDRNAKQKERERNKTHEQPRKNKPRHRIMITTITLVQCRLNLLLNAIIIIIIYHRARSNDHIVQFVCPSRRCQPNLRSAATDANGKASRRRRRRSRGSGDIVIIFSIHNSMRIGLCRTL